MAYQGPKDRETVYHAAAPISWRIVRLDGKAAMEGAMPMPCLSTEFVPRRVMRYPFQKSGVIGDTGPFNAAWFLEPALQLPPGQWRVSATLNISLGDCGGEQHALTTQIGLVVE